MGFRAVPVEKANKEGTGSPEVPQFTPRLYPASARRRAKPGQNLKIWNRE
jgi:hypothetical protein